MQSLNESFVNTISRSELANVTTELAEVTFDSILNEGIVKDIPFIGSLIGIYKGILTVRDKLFAKKVITFLASLNTLSINERELMFNKLEANGENRQKVGEALLLTLEQLDDFKKAALLGILMKSLSKSIIAYEDFQRFSSIINKSFIQDLMALPNFVNNRNGEAASTLNSLGLLTPTDYFTNDTAYDNNEYRLSQRGVLFCKALEMLS